MTSLSGRLVDFRDTGWFKTGILTYRFIWLGHLPDIHRRLASNGSRCLDAKYAPDHQQSPCWACYGLQRRHNERDGVSNHWRLDCLLSRLFRRTSKKTPKLSVTGLRERNPLVTGGFPSQRASNAEMFPFDDVIVRKVVTWVISRNTHTTQALTTVPWVWLFLTGLYSHRDSVLYLFKDSY